MAEAPPEGRPRLKSSADQCIIHPQNYKCDETESLISPNSFQSWQTLLEAAKIRNHTPVLDAAKTVVEMEVPKIKYHRHCRSVFAMKHTLDRLKRKAEEPAQPQEETSQTKRQSRGPSPTSRVFPKQCIFCEKSSKYLKNSNTREQLIQAKELRVDNTLRDLAVKKCDSKIIAVTSRDVVAAEAQYHRTCYRIYTKETSTDRLPTQEKADEEMPDDEERTYKKAEDASYALLFKHIKEELMAQPDVIPLVSLTEKLKMFMSMNGIKEVKDSTTRHIRRKLEVRFGDELIMFPDERGKVLVMPVTLSYHELGRMYQALKIQLSLWKSDSSSIDKVLDKASLHLRQAVKNSQNKSPWPIKPSDLDTMESVGPVDLKRFILALITGDPNNDTPSTRNRILIDSFTQDIVFAVSHGQQKTPKHFLLSYGVKSLTGNVELIKTLNRLGHGVSYEQLEENDTALCLQKLADAINKRVILPTSIQPYVMSNVSWDNIDRLEATLDGRGTSHRVNGIIVQPKVFGPHLPKEPVLAVEKTKARSVPTDTQQLACYVSGERVGPGMLTASEENKHEHQLQAKIARRKDLLWILSRYQVNIEFQDIPSWTGFNIKTRDLVQVREDVVGYLPTINAPATELATVQEIISQSELIRTTLHLETLVIVMDQALYAKAAEIIWKQRQQYENLVLRLGAFHVIMNVLSILGKRFQDAGLRDLCIESGILAEGSVTKVLEGKNYKRAVRTHKCVFEALMRMIWQGFIPWITDRHADMLPVVQELDNLISDFHDDVGQVTFQALLDNPVVCQILDLWDEYLQHLRHDNGDLSAFWMSYVDMVEDILLGLLRASREGNWDLHLHAIRSMIPWCFSYDKLNYARFLPVYYAEMTNLATDHPEIYEEFQKGNFSVQLATGNPFARIPVDQTTEVTVNKDTQTVGGTARFSLKAGAVSRYYLTAEYRSDFLTRLRNMIHLSKHGFDHPELQNSRIKKDEQAVMSVVETLTSWVNPFEANVDLISISTGATAPNDVAEESREAHAKGEHAYATFKTERLESNPPTKKFHAPMKKSQIKTFATATKKKQTKCMDGRSVILKADRALFGRMIVMGQCRDINMKDMLCHPLGPLPWSLATTDGSIRKTNKAALATFIKKNIPLADTVPAHSATIIDGMALVQRLTPDAEQTTFDDIAELIFAMAMKEASFSSRVDIVFDTYREKSIKYAERTKRGAELGLKVKDVTPGQMIKQWRRFLRQDANKTSLIKFLANEWQGEKYKQKLARMKKVLYVTCEDVCFRITGLRCREVLELQCFQEEADGRLLLHAMHTAEEGFEATVISSDDTDVFVLNLAFAETIRTRLFQKTGTRTRTHLLDINKIAASLGPDVCKALIGMHAYTGCDTVSAFAGKGKLNALKILKGDEDVKQAFLELGESWELTSELFQHLERFTCILYSKQGPSDVNVLRYHMYCAKDGEIESHQLPPCKDCLLKHAKRANFQAGLWRRSLSHDPDAPDPTQSGWKVENQNGTEVLVVDWMDVRPAPEAVIELLACKCTRACTALECTCIQHGLKCSDMCKLKECDNQPVDDDLEDVSELADDDDFDNDLFFDDY